MQVEVLPFGSVVRTEDRATHGAWRSVAGGVSGVWSRAPPGGKRQGRCSVVTCCRPIQVLKADAVRQPCVLSQPATVLRAGAKPPATVLRAGAKPRCAVL